MNAGDLQRLTNNILEPKEYDMKTIMRKCYQTALDKGWHDSPRTFGDMIALCHSELSEALEEHRSHGLTNRAMYYESESGKPEGIAVELADLLIRVFDLCCHLEIPLLPALERKMEYNTTRPYRHGGKVI